MPFSKSVNSPKKLQVHMYTNFRVQRYGSPRLSKSHSLIILKTAVLQLGVINIMLLFQNYTIGNLQKHTNYVITLAAKNLKGLGPNATIELRTEDGGNSCATYRRGRRAHVDARQFSASNTLLLPDALTLLSTFYCRRNCGHFFFLLLLPSFPSLLFPPFA